MSAGYGSIKKHPAYPKPQNGRVYRIMRNKKVPVARKTVIEMFEFDKGVKAFDFSSKPNVPDLVIADKDFVLEVKFADLRHIAVSVIGCAV